MVFIDTDLAINFLRKSNKSLSKKAKLILSDVFATNNKVKMTVFNLAELYRGAYVSSNVAKNLRIVKEFTSRFEIVPFTVEDAIVYSKIYAELKISGKPAGDFDELIASIIIREKDTLYTRNVKHYINIPSISVKNWEDL